MLMSGRCSINDVGDISSDLEEMMEQYTAFAGKCFGISGHITMSDVQIAACTKIVAISSATLNSQSLLPTTESFYENVKCVHFQAVWREHCVGHVTAL